MIINKKNRDEVLKKRIKYLEGKSGQETLKAMLELNKWNLELCKASIKAEKPDITDKEMLKELNKIYWENGRT